MGSDAKEFCGGRHSVLYAVLSMKICVDATKVECFVWIPTGLFIHFIMKGTALDNYTL